MTTIIQGSNDPIVLLVENADLDMFSNMTAVLYSGKQELKHWSHEELKYQENKYILLPLTESETLQFEEGPAKLDIKGIKKGLIEFMEEIKLYIVPRFNKDRMEASDES